MLRLLILIFALAAGAGAAWLTFSAPAARVADAPGPDLPPEVPTVTVLVAARAFAPGETLDPEGLRWQQWPVESGTDDLVVKTDDAGSIDDLAGVLVRREFLPGEPIRKAKLADGAGFLASLLPTGKRAVAVRISAENAAGGFVLPNDFVDVIFTRTRSADSGTAMESASRTLLRNIRVLAIDQTVEEGGDGGLSTLGKTATLELTPDQVETLMSAGASGTLSLSREDTWSRLAVFHA